MMSNVQKHMKEFEILSFVIISRITHSEHILGDVGAYVGLNTCVHLF